MLKIKNLKINNTDNNLNLIEDVNLFVNEGEIVLLEGRNGSGKSTILNTIMHHPDYKIESGEVLLNDRNITRLEGFELARLSMFISLQHAPEIEGLSTIKMLYGSYKILNPDSSKNITNFKKELEEECNKFDLDTSLLLRDVNVGFSGGQKKQAELMHMLALNPKVILMDEPDSGVDKEAVAKVFEVIKYFQSKGAAIIITSHNEKIKSLDIARVYVVENKKVTLQ
ncbi:MAG: Fe-S cluster assembly ATP-binding protein [Patescibacteria group bacterium]|nr:Fe-S cluster assembly ATP-binding protein [Patescibacteria group bacterium]